MYLTDCIVKNLGAIDSLEISLETNEQGNPTPLIIVGQNGSGKSILISAIADALIEFAKTAYEDTVSGHHLGRSPYFRLVGPTTQRVNTGFSLTVLKFSHDSQQYYFVEKSGILDPNEYSVLFQERFGTNLAWPVDGNHKTVTPSNKDFFEQYFRNSATCYFPPNRHEQPHWLNRESVSSETLFDLTQRIAGRLRKPIIVESAADKNKQWILDVILDSKVDFQVTQQGIVLNDDIPDKLLLQQSRTNINYLLGKVLQDSRAYFDLNYRSISPYRLAISNNNGLLIPSLDHLSSGQAILFNMFATIIRYADKGDVNKSIQLNQIEGIALIDEIDAHLHSDLQYELLPELIRIFPKVQFIVSSHSPLFLLGMENKFGSEGITIIEMPSGKAISTERFSEFQRSFDYYRQTKRYEDDLEQELQSGLKPLVLTEGKHDVQYIQTALQLLGREDILSRLDIQQVGTQGPHGAVNSGRTGLDVIDKVVRAKPDLTPRRLLLLYDCDTNKSPYNSERLMIRSIPQMATTRIKNGIENLLPPALVDDRFYSTKVEDLNDGGSRITTTILKNELVKYICEERREPQDFQNFTVVIDFLDEFLASGY